MVSSELSSALKHADKLTPSNSAFSELDKFKGCGVYINPFRVVNFSILPSHILQELKMYPIVTQIAILSNSDIRQKYFPNWKQ